MPERAWLGFSSFVGQYAGEHTAGTELMIGPLFIASGVSAFDVVGGLFVGNLLAVLSWMFLTAPIAVRARLTLYFQLEKICGRKLVTAYNLANGVMFCFLAGAMVTVNATAAGVWFDIAMPGLNDLYPNSVGWVVDRPRDGRAHHDRRGVRLQGGGAHRQHRRAVDGAGLHRLRHHRRAPAGHRLGGRVLAEGAGAHLDRRRAARRAGRSSPSGT